MSKLEDFVNVAVDKSGWGFEAFASWAKSIGTAATPNAWCAEFVCACAKAAGILGTIIASTSSARGVVESSANSLGGELKYRTTGYTPQPGDLIWLNWNGRSDSAMDGNHAGIVRDCNSTHVYTVEGNTSKKSVELKSYRLDCNYIIAYCHPNWQLAGDGSGSSLWGDLYSMRNTREDAIVREVLYEDNNKIVPYYTRDKISVGNYTDVFAELWDWGKILLQPLYNLDGVEGSARIVIQFFIDKGCEPAAGCGVAGNIKAESGFDTTSYVYDPDELGNPGWSSGICQWRAGRGEAMRRFVGDNWKNDLSGQLEYLWHELETSYTAVKNHLLSVKNNEEGVRSSTDIFVRQFERPANPGARSQERQVFAMEYFNTIVPMIATSNNGIGHPLGVNF